eukprot:6212518-Pleurochrysis_carterae.AAC.14
MRLGCMDACARLSCGDLSLEASLRGCAKLKRQSKARYVDSHVAAGASFATTLCGAHVCHRSAYAAALPVRGSLFMRRLLPVQTRGFTVIAPFT